MQNIQARSIFLLLLLLTVPLFAESRPTIEVLNAPWDFGQIKIGSISEKIFLITNTGEKDLSIKGVRSCCGYSMVELSSWVIAPNEQSEITISCNSEFKNPGIDKKYFTIKSNDPDNPEVKVLVISHIVE